MPKLVRLYITHVVIGYVISAAFVALLLWLNVANLWHLVTHAPGGWLAVGLLWFFNGIVFAGVQFALALPSDRNRPKGGTGSKQPAQVMMAEPVPVRTNTE